MQSPMRLRPFHKPPAVVLGLGQNGLATCRALGRLGIPVLGVDSDLAQPGARTRYCRPLRCEGFARGGVELADFLVDLGRQLDQKAVLLPSGDLNVQTVSEHREALAPYFHLTLPAKETLRLFLDKKAFYKIAMERGFPLPRTYFTEAGHDIDRIAGEIEYPCLIKPYQPNAVWRETFDTRLFLADSADMLRSLYDLIYPVHQDLIIQEYMPGDDSQVVWGVTFLGEGGDPLALWTGRKLRMYPRGFGTATLAESLRQPWVGEKTVEILRSIGHRGYGVVEYKRDRRDGELKITEATGGRTWFPHGLVTRSGINLPLIWYRDALGERVEPALDFEEHIRWIHEERDLKTVMLYFLPEGRLDLRSWLASYRGRRTYAYACWDDPRPLLVSVGRIAEAGWNRLRRRLRLRRPERAEAVRARKSRPRHLEDLLLAADPTVGHGLRRISVD